MQASFGGDVMNCPNCNKQAEQTSQSGNDEIIINEYYCNNCNTCIKLEFTNIFLGSVE